MGSPLGGPIGLLQEDERVLRWNVELAAAGLAGDGVVDPNHVVAQLRVQRAVALVRAGRDAILLRADNPAHLVVIDALAAWTRELVGPCLVAVIEEVTFIERHERIILSFLNGDRLRTHVSERAAGARAS